MKITKREDREFLIDLDGLSKVYLSPCSSVGASYDIAVNAGIPKPALKDNLDLYDNFDEICDKNPHFNHNAAKDSILNNQKLNRSVLRVWGVQSNTAKRAWYKMNVGDYVVFNRGNEKKGSEYFAISTVSSKIESEELSYYLSKKGFWMPSSENFKYIFFLENYYIIKQSKKSFAKKFGLTETYPSMPFKLFPGKDSRSEFGDVQSKIIDEYNHILIKNTDIPIEDDNEDSTDKLIESYFSKFDNDNPEPTVDIRPKSKKKEDLEFIEAKKEDIKVEKKKVKKKKTISIGGLREQAAKKILEENGGNTSAGQVYKLLEEINDVKLVKRLIKVPDIRNLKTFAKEGRKPLKKKNISKNTVKKNEPTKKKVVSKKITKSEKPIKPKKSKNDSMVKKTRTSDRIIRLGKIGSLKNLNYLIGRPKCKEGTGPAYFGVTKDGFLSNKTAADRKRAIQSILKIIKNNPIEDKSVKFWAEQSVFALYESLKTEENILIIRHILRAIFEINQIYIREYRIDIITGVYKSNINTYDYNDYSDYFFITDIFYDNNNSIDYDLSKKILDQVASVSIDNKFDPDIFKRIPKLGIKTSHNTQKKEKVDFNFGGLIFLFGIICILFYPVIGVLLILFSLLIMSDE